MGPLYSYRDMHDARVKRTQRRLQSNHPSDASPGLLTRTESRALPVSKIRCKLH